VVIAVISNILEQFEANTIFKLISTGVRAGVAILILNAALKLSKKLKRNTFTFAIIIAAFLIALFTNIDIILLLIVGAILGIVYGALSHDHYDVGGIE
jgi:chromate transporter